jgi:diguanylate cyclase (GGDEF)-like protein
MLRLIPVARSLARACAVLNSTVMSTTADAPPPPFSLFDAEQIVRRLGPALREHGEWIQRVHAVLVCRTPADPDDVAPGSHLRSGLGQWFAQEPNEFIRGRPEYAEASAYHREVHDLAQALCRAVSEDSSIALADYDSFARAIDRLDDSLEALVKELWDLLRFTDPLTGIATRFAMLPRLKQERDRVARTGQTCSVCMVDLDRFKAVNDAFGHAGGDTVLAAVSEYFVRNLRPYDQVCRYGGEEFVLMLPNTPIKAAVPVVDRLRRGLAEMPIDLGSHGHIRMTASFGIAELCADKPVTDSIGKADLAMYEAKRAGRNQVRVWSEQSAAHSSM